MRGRVRADGWTDRWSSWYSDFWTPLPHLPSVHSPKRLTGDVHGAEGERDGLNLWMYEGERDDGGGMADTDSYQSSNTTAEKKNQIKHNNNNSNNHLQRWETSPGGCSSPPPSTHHHYYNYYHYCYHQNMGGLVNFIFTFFNLHHRWVRYFIFLISEKKLSINLELLRFDPCLVPLWRSPPWREARWLVLN